MLFQEQDIDEAINAIRIYLKELQDAWRYRNSKADIESILDNLKTYVDELIKEQDHIKNLLA